MASDGSSVALPVANAVQRSQDAAGATPPSRGGKLSPPVGNSPPIGAVSAADAASSSRGLEGSVKTVRASAPQSLDAIIANVNKAFNDSGTPTQFRLDPTSGNKVIQQINPATGKVVAELAASDFPALAGGLGIPGLFVDSRA